MDEKIVELVPFSKRTPQVRRDYKRIRVAAYVRTSTKMDTQFSSLYYQTEYLMEYIRERPQWEFVDIYRDQGKRGIDFKRGEFQRMIQDALNGKIDLIIVKSISRFGREVSGILYYIRLLKSKGVTVFFVQENLYSNDIDGEFTITVIAAVAQEQSRNLSENVKWGFRKRLEMGDFEVPYRRILGFVRAREKTECRYEICASEAKVVRCIYFLYLIGCTTHEIAEILNNGHVQKHNDVPGWGYHFIYSILKNEKYCGRAVLQKTLVEEQSYKKIKNKGELPKYLVLNNHEPIINCDVWNFTQERMTRNLQRNISHYPLNGHMRCGVCGDYLTLFSRFYRGGDILDYYQCRSKYYKKTCESSIIYKWEMDQMIKEAVKECFFVYKDVLPAVSNIIKNTALDEDTINRVNSFLRHFPCYDLKHVSKANVNLLFDAMYMQRKRKLDFALLDGQIVTVTFFGRSGNIDKDLQSERIERCFYKLHRYNPFFSKYHELLFCGNCGRIFHATTTHLNNDVSSVEYICQSRWLPGVATDNCPIRESTLDTVVISFVEKTLVKNDSVFKAIGAVTGQYVCDQKRLKRVKRFLKEFKYHRIESMERFEQSSLLQKIIVGENQTLTVIMYDGEEYYTTFSRGMELSDSLSRRKQIIENKFYKSIGFKPGVNYLYYRRVICGKDGSSVYYKFKMPWYPKGRFHCSSHQTECPKISWEELDDITYEAIHRSVFHYPEMLDEIYIIIRRYIVHTKKVKGFLKNFKTHKFSSIDDFSAGTLFNTITIIKEGELEIEMYDGNKMIFSFNGLPTNQYLRAKSNG